MHQTNKRKLQLLLLPFITCFLIPPDDQMEGKEKKWETRNRTESGGVERREEMGKKKKEKGRKKQQDHHRKRGRKELGKKEGRNKQQKT